MDTLPPVGLGTMGIDSSDVIATALDVGYRHLDTAQLYENETAVGEGLHRADVAREDVFVATKLWVDRLAPEDVRAGVEESLDRLGLDRIDLLYVHRPRGTYDPETTLPAFDELRDDGLIDHVGVSNFEPDGLDEAREILDAPIFAHQVELHPLFYTPELVAYARDHGHRLVAYSPLAGGRVADVPELVAIADEHGVTPAAVSLAWLASKEAVVTIPKASSREHLESNFGARDLELDEADVERIEGIDREEQLYPE